jgi:integrating conjugative element relaxase (TIGR03760 family)
MLALFTGLFHRPPKPASPAVPVLPAGVWPVLPAAQLLRPHAQLLAHIRTLVGTSPDYWAALYQPLLDNFAAFVQQTPASEAHHHCCQGGMLTHSLQVMKLALEARKGKMLPPGAAAEEVNRQQHAWTYATASAALLHDVGKPCSDQKLRLFAADGQDTHHYWEPLHGALQSAHYRVEFVRDRQYRTHELLPPLLARQLTPPVALSWLQQDFPGVFKAWLGYLSGQDEVAGVLGQMVTEADMQSVADDLSGGVPTHTQQIPTAKAKPLSQRLLTGLRFMLDNQQVTLNRPGAAGFFDGESLWLVSKRVLDDIRTHLEKEGQTGIPSRNDRLMDELQQHNILTPTASGQAIWNATVKAGTMEVAFTLLRIPATTLWADPAQYPKPLDGSVIPNAKDGEAATAPQPAPIPSKPIPATATPTAATTAQVANVVAAGSGGDDVEDWLPDAISTPELAFTQDPFPDQALPTPMADGGSVPAWGDDDGLMLPVVIPDSTAVAAVTVTAAPATTAPPPLAIPQATGDPDSDDTGQRFLNWLSQGLRLSQHKLNTRDAFMHTVKEGLLLVSPRVFKEFAGENGWDYAQKRFTKLGLHRKAPDGGNIWLYNVRGETKSGVVRGFLLANPIGALGLVYLPVPNKSLSLPDNTR